jgi:dTDP-4-dehydrorhamnose 3,5-epimerase
MPFIHTPFPDLLIFEPHVHRDERGYFLEAFNQKTFLEAGIKSDFVQDNQAKSTKGVLRGLHFQKGEHAQAKLVRVLQGSVLDVVVDIRKESPTFGLSFSIELNDENKRQLYVPRGFAHGYVVLSDTAVFFYKCDNFYSPAHESGIKFNDPKLNIDWILNEHELVLSEKDQNLPIWDKFSLE